MLQLQICVIGLRLLNEDFEVFVQLQWIDWQLSEHNSDVLVEIVPVIPILMVFDLGRIPW